VAIPFNHSPNVFATGLTANRHTAETGPTREKATFWIKARDASGNWSLNAAKATLNVYTRASLDVLTIDRKQTVKSRMLALEAGRAGGGLGLVDVPAIMRTNLNAAYAELDALLAGAGGDCAWDSLDGPTYLGEGGGAALEAALGNAAAALADLTDAAQRAERAKEIAAAKSDLEAKLATFRLALATIEEATASLMVQSGRPFEPFEWPHF
jgi:multidrug efflux pump subunit AcrA (membrane-fusion protein)